MFFPIMYYLYNCLNFLASFFVCFPELSLFVLYSFWQASDNFLPVRCILVSSPGPSLFTKCSRQAEEPKFLFGVCNHSHKKLPQSSFLVWFLFSCPSCSHFDLNSEKSAGISLWLNWGVGSQHAGVCVLGYTKNCF